MIEKMTENSNLTESLDTSLPIRKKNRIYLSRKHDLVLKLTANTN